MINLVSLLKLILLPYYPKDLVKDQSLQTLGRSMYVLKNQQIAIRIKAYMPGFFVVAWHVVCDMLTLPACCCITY